MARRLRILQTVVIAGVLIVGAGVVGLGQVADVQPQVGLAELELDPLAAIAAAPPNVLIVFVDDLGIDKVGAYCPKTTDDLDCDRSVGRTDMVPPTPRMNELATQGVRFTRAYAEPSCSPSRASLMTGHTVANHGIGTVLLVKAVQVPDNGLDPALPTLAHLAPETFTTVMLGKWHLSAHEDHGLRGAEDAVGGDRDGVTDLCANEADPGLCARFDRRPLAYGFDRFDGRLRHTIAFRRWARSVAEGSHRSALWQDSSQDPNQYFTTAMTQAALDVVNGDDGWLMVVGYQAPHEPYHPVPYPKDLPGVLHDPDTKAYSAVPGEYDPDYGDELTQQQAGELVQSLDHHLGVLLDHVDFDTTTVVFASDNGSTGSAIDPEYVRDEPGGRQQKLHVLEAGVRVPLIIAGAGVDPALHGTTQPALTHIRDIFATVAELMGSEVDVPESSRSLLPHLTGGLTAPKEAVFVGKSYSVDAPHNNNGPPYSTCAVGVRTNKAKLVIDNRPVIEMYRLDEGAPLQYEDYANPYSRQTRLGDLCADGATPPPPAAGLYRKLRDVMLTQDSGNCWIAEHEVNCCDDVDNDGDGQIDDLDPDCHCDPDKLTPVEACTTPAQ